MLDPFCGCATTAVAAERLGRQWVGMDIWDGAHEIVLKRLEQELDKDALWGKRVHFLTEPPIRTDEDEQAITVPDLELRGQRVKPAWEKLSHREMATELVQAQGTVGGVICAGCGRVLEKEFMELDHIRPKSERGENHILNRILLCRPCNGKKKHYLTLTGLQRENKKDSWMQNEALAKRSHEKARHRAEQIRANGRI